MRPRSQVFRCEAQRHRGFERLNCLHLLIEPLLRVGTKPVCPTHTSAQILHSQMLQPFHAGLKAVIFKVKPLTNPQPLREN